MIRRRVIGPLLALLRQGMTPERLALTIALGFALGIIPVLGSTTLLCTAAALALGLNLAAIQIVNQAVYPLQLLLLIPFLRAGAWLFRDNSFTLSRSDLMAMLHAGVWHAIQTLWVATVHALVVWAIVGAVASAAIYVAGVPLLRRVALRRSGRG